MKEAKRTFKFFTDSVGYQSIEEKGTKKHYITGYISTKDRDLVNDIVTEGGMSDMMNQLIAKNIKLDVEHEAWRLENPTIIPIGKIIEAKSDEKGIFIKAELNGSHQRFGEVWSSIKDGFVDAFSIAYQVKDAVHRLVDGVKTRLLNKVELLNVAITGNPVNPECKMVNVFTKSLDDMEELKMTEESTATPEETQEETKEEDNTQEEPETKDEEASEEESAEEVAEETEEETEVEEKAKKLVDENKSLKAKLDSMNAEIKELKAKLERPILKSETPETPDAEEKKEEVEEKDINPLDMI